MVNNSTVAALLLLAWLANAACQNFSESNPFLNDTGVPTVAPTQSMEAPTVDPAACRDLHDDCKQFKGQGHCFDSYKDYMAKNCKLSCGICTDGNGNGQVTGLDHGHLIVHLHGNGGNGHGQVAGSGSGNGHPFGNGFGGGHVDMHFHAH